MDLSKIGSKDQMHRRMHCSPTGIRADCCNQGRQVLHAAIRANRSATALP